MTQSTAETATSSSWVPDDSTFGARLALIRQRMKWTNVAQAARECGVPADSWRNWEEGMEPRRLVTIAMAISTRTGVDLDWLVYGRAKPAPHVTGRYLPVDPLAARTLARTGQIRRGDGRRKPRGGSPSTRPVTPIATSTHPKRAESHAA